MAMTSVPYVKATLLVCDGRKTTTSMPNCGSDVLRPCCVLGGFDECASTQHIVVHGKISTLPVGVIPLGSTIVMIHSTFDLFCTRIAD